MKIIRKICLVVAAIYLLVGCVRYTVPEVVPVELLEIYKKENAEVPVKVRIINFHISPIDADYSDDDKDTFRRYNESNIPDKLYYLLGGMGAFSEVKRTISHHSGVADYMVSGKYYLSETKEKRTFHPHSLKNGKGVLHVRVMRSGDGHFLLDKDFVEEQSYEGISFKAMTARYLQDPFMKNIATEIKKNIALDVILLRTRSQSKTLK